MKNIKITAEELQQIRSLPDFDLTMLLSEIHDHGWPVAHRTLPMIVRVVAKRPPELMTDDKRLIPELNNEIWAKRESEKQWHDCKYCHKEVPTFVLAEGFVGDPLPAQTLRCCWECGYGLELLSHRKPT